MNAWASVIRRVTPGKARFPIPKASTRPASVSSVLFPRSILRREHSSVDPQVFYEQKYADKLKRKAESEGVKTVQELKDKVLKPVKVSYTYPTTRATTDTATNAVNDKSSTDARKIPSASSVEYTSNGLPSNVKPLDKILKLDKVLAEDAETIGKIWTEYHANKDCLSAVIPAETYGKLFERSKKYPLFVLPVPRQEGAEMYLLQFAFHQCYFTSLLEYKTHGENARPYLTLTHYTDLKDSKNIVLMHGEIADKPRILSPQDAQFLVYALQQFYVTGSERKKKLVEKFHHDPSSFDVQELIDELEKLD
ncbi:ATP11-domain-containing protein [Basidiobolus meristosporus CBS 931.73]|uniref:ATP11-domain-containing protein n=1 Tax=Basidiobolus meristosporus CBS 931.73 TaxID=1314790 RepID=A0A1Y1YBI4_9FUNG|nr:ATP11-domain-containing protein [Basidiobolus meristosporus CBS 931.73]|eukprot:ORX95126.1 ATP11-domain-containing protein [Basidiobolus meristosporus CBS 931.73]